MAASIRIKDCVRKSDIAARLGGDEFAVALVQADLESGSDFAERLIEIVSRPYRLAEAEAVISASIGAAARP